MKSRIRHLPLDKLVAHPDNPNRMSRANFGKLMRHIKRTGCYEPLVVRRHPQQRGCFQIINGYHRCAALKKLGQPTAQAVVWDVSDEQTDILLATLNRLRGRDILDRKLVILRRLIAKHPARELAKLLPQTKGQLERLTGRAPLARALRQKTKAFAIPLVFFVSDTQQETIEKALSQVATPEAAKTRAAQRAAALTDLVTRYATQATNETSA